jgi:hypothetical protein
LTIDLLTRFWDWLDSSTFALGFLVSFAATLLLWLLLMMDD